MEKGQIKIDILPNQFLKSDGKFNQENALDLCGKIAGVCYDKEGFKHLEKEDILKTNRRIDITLNNGHHSVYDHINISFNLQNIPKILAMVINNEHQYTTSEKSARYTQVTIGNDSIITSEEERLYNKWVEIFKVKIKKKYSYIYNNSKIQKLAQENARYLITVFMPTQMIYTTSLRQINYLASWMIEYMGNYGIVSKNCKLDDCMEEFINELERLNILVPRLMQNEKGRGLSLFGKDLGKREDYFGDVYTTTYKGSFAELAQAHRHRTLDYQMEVLDKSEYFVPPIIKDDDALVEEWLYDINSVREVNPQGKLVLINESGKYEDFILKCKERLCSEAQLEIMNQTKETLEKYRKELNKKNHRLLQDIEQYSKGARCTFPDFKCLSDCKFNEGKTLRRKI